VNNRQHTITRYQLLVTLAARLQKWAVFLQHFCNLQFFEPPAILIAQSGYKNNLKFISNKIAKAQ
jgi:hypothetical protein